MRETRQGYYRALAAISGLWEKKTRSRFLIARILKSLRFSKSLKREAEKERERKRRARVRLNGQSKVATPSYIFVGVTSLRVTMAVTEDWKV